MKLLSVNPSLMYDYVRTTDDGTTWRGGGTHADGSVVVKGQQNSSLVRDPIEWIEPDRERQRETERLKGEDDAQLSLLNTDAIIGSEPIPRRGDY